jgi:hypothetical protein
MMTVLVRMALIKMVLVRMALIQVLPLVLVLVLVLVHLLALVLVLRQRFRPPYYSPVLASNYFGSVR